jgi:hypothetical protein
VSDPWLPPFVHPPAAADPPPARPRRSPRVRAAWTTAAVLVTAALLMFRPWPAADVPRILAPLPHVTLVDLPGSLLVAAALLVVLPRVSYRRRDALLVLVPYVPLWLVGMAVWRLSGLPYRDWRPRDDERSRVRVVPGTPFYVLAGERVAAASAQLRADPRHGGLDVVDDGGRPSVRGWLRPLHHDHRQVQ